MIQFKKFLFYTSCTFLLLSGCEEKTSFLNGEMIVVDDIRTTDTLIGEQLVFDSINSGIISLCDSLAFFYSHRMPDYQYYCFNIRTGKHISNFFPLGKGAGEFLNVTPIIQKYKENGEIKALFAAINEKKAGVFNITKSIEQKKTVCDTVFDCQWSKTRPFSSFFQYNDNKILAYKRPDKISSDENKYSLPQYLMIDCYTGNVERTYDLYKEPGIYNPGAKDLNGDFYSSLNLMKPDRTKVAMFMTLAPQINILDVETGNLKGITLSGAPGFEDLEKCNEFRQYHAFSDVDDKYIYALYIDKDYMDFDATISSCVLRVFDWEGNFIYKFYINVGLDQIQIDAENSLMYGVCLATEEVFRYQLPF